MFDWSNRAVRDHNFLHCFSHLFPSGATMLCNCSEADGVIQNQGRWSATKKIVHPTKASHELFGLNLNMSAEAKSALARTIIRVVNLRPAFFISSPFPLLLAHACSRRPRLKTEDIRHRERKAKNNCSASYLVLSLAVPRTERRRGRHLG